MLADKSASLFRPKKTGFRQTHYKSSHSPRQTLFCPISPPPADKRLSIPHACTPRRSRGLYTNARMVRHAHHKMAGVEWVTLPAADKPRHSLKAKMAGLNIIWMTPKPFDWFDFAHHRQAQGKYASGLNRFGTDFF